jgi:hypothetical protein
MSRSGTTALVRLVLASDRKRGLYGEHPAAPEPTWEFDRIERHGTYLHFYRLGLEVNRCKISAIEAIEVVKPGDDFDG